MSEKFFEFRVTFSKQYCFYFIFQKNLEISGHIKIKYNFWILAFYCFWENQFLSNNKSRIFRKLFSERKTKDISGYFSFKWCNFFKIDVYLKKKPRNYLLQLRLKKQQTILFLNCILFWSCIYIIEFFENAEKFEFLVYIFL